MISGETSAREIACAPRDMKEIKALCRKLGIQFVYQMMNFVFMIVDFALKMMDFVLKMMDFVLKMMNFGRGSDVKRSHAGGLRQNGPGRQTGVVPTRT